MPQPYSFDLNHEINQFKCWDPKFSLDNEVNKEARFAERISMLSNRNETKSTRKSG
jgi:hypothetical protein